MKLKIDEIPDCSLVVEQMTRLLRLNGATWLSEGAIFDPMPLVLLLQLLMVCLDWGKIWLDEDKKLV